MESVNIEPSCETSIDDEIVTPVKDNEPIVQQETPVKEKSKKRKHEVSSEVKKSKKKSKKTK